MLHLDGLEARLLLSGGGSIGAAALPSAPSSLTTQPLSSFDVRLTWHDNSSDESHFRIERSTSAAFTSLDATFLAGSGVTSFNDETARPLTRHFYRVVAVNADGASASALADAITPGVTRPAYHAVDPASQYFSPQNFRLRGGQVLFDVYTYATEAWRPATTNGSSIIPIDPATIDETTAVGDTLYYVRHTETAAQLWKRDRAGGPAALVRSFPSIGSMAALNGQLFFSADDGAHGTELWATDGTPAGTRLVKDVRPPNVGNTIHSDPWGFLAGETRLYFYANDGDHGMELWRTDGTADGTTLVSDFNPGASSVQFIQSASTGFIGDLVVLGDTLYWRGPEPGGRPGAAKGVLYTSDGTPEGTEVFSDLAPLFTTVVGDRLFFLGRWPDLFGRSYSLVVSDGTPAGTVQVKELPSMPAYWPGMVAIGNKVFFADRDTLWVSDGTTQGTLALKTIPNANDMMFKELTAAAGRLYFRHLDRLWTSDGTVAGTMQLTPAGAGFTNPNELTNVQDVLYFAGTDSGGFPRLWRYAPVLPAAPAAPTGLAASAFSAERIDLNWNDSSTDEEGFILQRSTSPTFDTVERTVQLGANATSYTDLGLVRGQTYYYRVRAFNTGGRSQAAVAGPVTTPLAPAAPSGLTASAPDAHTVDLAWMDNSTNEDGFVLQRSTRSNFATIDKSVTLSPGVRSYHDTGLTRLTRYYYRLWAFDEAGRSASALVKVTTPEAIPAAPSGLIGFGVSRERIDLQWEDNSDNETGFVIERRTSGEFQVIGSVPANATGFSDFGRAAASVYRYRVRALNVVGSSAYSDVARAGTLPPQLTTRVRELAPLTAAHPDWLTRVGDDVYFAASRLNNWSFTWTQAAGVELWKTDGTAGGSVLLHSGPVRDLHNHNGTLYFASQNNDGRHGIWKTNGTPLGTVEVTRLAGDGASPARIIASVGDQLFVAVPYSDPYNSIDYDLWVTDGTAAGTRKLSTNSTRVRYIDVSSFAVHEGKLYLSGAGNFGATVRTDGTPEGTVRIDGMTTPHHFTSLGGELLFVAQKWGESSGEWFWRVSSSSAAPEPFFKLHGYSGQMVTSMTRAEGKLFFTNWDLDHGREVWTSDGTAAGTRRVTHVIPEDPAYPGNPSPSPSLLTEAGGDVYFITPDMTVNGLTTRGGIWRTDGTQAGTVRIRDFAITGPGVRHLYMLEVQGKLVFSDGLYLWRSDGTPAGTVQIDRVGAGEDGTPLRWFGGAAATVLGDRLFFAAAAEAGLGEIRIATLTPPRGPSALGGGSQGQSPASPAPPGPLGPGPQPLGVHLVWADNADTETGFLIERSLDPEFAELDQTFFRPADAASFTDETASPADGFYYRVAAVNAGGNSPYSNIIGPWDYAPPKLIGDLDRDQRITISDYFIIDRGRAMRLGGYGNGDLNFSGGVADADDYMLLDRGFVAGQHPLAAAPPAAVPPQPGMAQLPDGFDFDSDSDDVLR